MPKKSAISASGLKKHHGINIRIPTALFERMNDARRTLGTHGESWNLTTVLTAALEREVAILEKHIKKHYGIVEGQTSFDLDGDRDDQELQEEISDNAQISDSGISDSIDEMFEPLTKQTRT